jgi:ArsR family transcriptional regulator
MTTTGDNTERLAEAFKALSNPNRLKIFLQLMNCCAPGTVCSAEGVTADLVTKSCVGDLGEGLAIAASTLSHHIKELNRAGLIHMERRGQHIDCWVDPDTVDELYRFFRTED